MATWFHYSKWPAAADNKEGHLHVTPGFSCYLNGYDKYKATEDTVCTYHNLKYILEENSQTKHKN